MGNGSLTPICSLSNHSLSNRSLSLSLTVPLKFIDLHHLNWNLPNHSNLNLSAQTCPNENSDFYLKWLIDNVRIKLVKSYFRTNPEKPLRWHLKFPNGGYNLRYQKLAWYFDNKGTTNWVQTSHSSVGRWVGGIRGGWTNWTRPWTTAVVHD